MFGVNYDEPVLSRFDERRHRRPMLRTVAPLLPPRYHRAHDTHALHRADAHQARIARWAWWYAEGPGADAAVAEAVAQVRAGVHVRVAAAGVGWHVATLVRRARERGVAVVLGEDGRVTVEDQPTIGPLDVHVDGTDEEP